MALLERVSTLLRANLNDLVDRAENPEKMIKQVLIDMENQYMQVKTQVAIAIADLHLLEKKRKDNEQTSEEWMRKAEFAVGKEQDDLAKAALEKALGAKQMAKNFEEQIADQRSQVDVLKNALENLERKISEAKQKADLLVTQIRRNRVVERASDASTNGPGPANTFDRMKDKALRGEAIAQAKVELTGEDLEQRFAKLEREQEVEKLLAEIKQRKQLSA